LVPREFEEGEIDRLSVPVEADQSFDERAAEAVPVFDHRRVAMRARLLAPDRRLLLDFVRHHALRKGRATRVRRRTSRLRETSARPDFPITIFGIMRNLSLAKPLDSTYHIS
jgi:hypothetical protein